MAALMSFTGQIRLRRRARATRMIARA